MAFKLVSLKEQTDGTSICSFIHSKTGVHPVLGEVLTEEWVFCKVKSTALAVDDTIEDADMLQGMSIKTVTSSSGDKSSWLVLAK